MSFPLFSASMMCAKYGNLEQEVKQLETAVDSFHVDIMDGEFVDNFGMGYQDMEFIRQHTEKFVDVHLMVCKPLLYLPLLFELGVDVVYIHPEADRDPATTIEKIKANGLTAGIAVNPGTAVSTISELLNVVDRVLVLGVNPGHAGRKYQNYVDKKISKLLELRSSLNFQIWLDGAVTVDRINYWFPRGVDGFILGTSFLFKDNGLSYSEKIMQFRSLSSNTK